jgi:hypothetical protein
VTVVQTRGREKTGNCVAPANARRGDTGPARGIRTDENPLPHQEHTMKKIAPDVETLSIESFEVGGSVQMDRGTVQ